MPFYILLHLKEACDKLDLEDFWKLLQLDGLFRLV